MLVLFEIGHIQKDKVVNPQAILDEAVTAAGGEEYREFYKFIFSISTEKMLNWIRERTHEKSGPDFRQPYREERRISFRAAFRGSGGATVLHHSTEKEEVPRQVALMCLYCPRQISYPFLSTVPDDWVRMTTY